MQILVISDIHANLTAFKTVLADADGEWDYIWCLGDMVGYGPDPNECIELLKTLPHICLAGNHDWGVLGRVDIRGFNPDARGAVEWTQETLKPENIEFLEVLPIKFVIGNYTLVHGSPREPIWEYVLEPLVAKLNFPHFETPYCFVGHTHQPVIYEQANNNEIITYIPNNGDVIKLSKNDQIINPGSIGQPRDQNPDAAYGILDTETNTFEHRRIPYDIHDVQQRMEIYGFSEYMVASLHPNTLKAYFESGKHLELKNKLFNEIYSNRSD